MAEPTEPRSGVTATFTAPVKPFVLVMFTTPYPLHPFPAGRSNSTGSTEMVKPIGRAAVAVTVSDTLPVWVAMPVPLAEIVRVAFPADAFAEAVMVRTALDVAGSRVAGAKEAVTPPGSPLTERATVPLKLPPRTMVTVMLVLPAMLTVAAVVGMERVSVPPCPPGCVGVPPPPSPPPHAPRHAAASATTNGTSPRHATDGRSCNAGRVDSHAVPRG